MNEPELFLVSVIFGSEGHEVDVELPSQLTVGEIRRRLPGVLKSLYVDEFTDGKTYMLEYDNRILNDDDTLLKAGAFDGSKIYLIEA